jgi:hypothetical protein
MTERLGKRNLDSFVDDFTPFRSRIGGPLGALTSVTSSPPMARCSGAP